MKTIAASMVMAMVGAGCGVTGQLDELTPCAGKCDGAAAAPIVSCFITPDTNTDPFFRADRLSCLYAPAGAGVITLQSTTVELRTASGTFASDRLTGAGALDLPTLASDAYPISLDVTLVIGALDRPGLRSLEYRNVTEHLVIEAATEAPEAQPRTVALPFAVWQIQLANRHPGSTALRLDHDVAAEPTLAIEETISLPFGARKEVHVVVPRGATSLPVAILGEPTVSGTLHGPGAYEVTADGELVRAAPVANAGLVTALCNRLVNRLGTSITTEIRCQTIADASVVAATLEIDATAGGPMMYPLDGIRSVVFDGEIEATVTLRTTVADVVVDLEDVADRTFTTTAALTDATPELIARLPFDLRRTRWLVSNDAHGLITLPARQLDLGDHTPGAVTVPERTESFSPGSDTLLYLAVPAGTPIAASGTIVPVVSGGVTEDLAVTIERPGTWRVSPSGFAFTP